MGLKGISSSHVGYGYYISSSISTRKRNEIFLIRVVTNHVKVDTLFGTSSQANLISDEIVKELNLETTLHQRLMNTRKIFSLISAKVDKQGVLEHGVFTGTYQEDQTYCYLISNNIHVFVNVSNVFYMESG